MLSREVTLHTRQSCLVPDFNSGRAAVSGVMERNVQWLKTAYISHTMCYKIYMIRFKTVWFFLCWSLLPHSFIHRRLTYIKELMTDPPVINITLSENKSWQNGRNRKGFCLVTYISSQISDFSLWFHQTKLC